jgi:hypothetical protein
MSSTLGEKRIEYIPLNLKVCLRCLVTSEVLKPNSFLGLFQKQPLSSRSDGIGITVKEQN